MALPGLVTATWIGWALGVLLIKQPWGKPTLPGVISFTTLLFIINFGMTQFISQDAYVNYYESAFRPFTQDNKKIVTAILRISLIELITSNLLIRLALLLQSKNLIKLWEGLYNRVHTKTWELKYFKGNAFNLTLTTVAFIASFAFAVVDGIPYGENVDKSWLQPVGKVPFTILVLLFLIVPTVVPINCAFSICLGTLYNLRWVYSEYCEKIHSLILEKAMQKQRKGMRREPLLSQEFKESLIEELEEIQELFRLSECAISPLIYIIMSGGTIRLVATAARIFFGDLHNPEKIARDASELVVIMCFLWLLEVGQQFSDAFAYWRDKLKTAVVQIGPCETVETLDLYDIQLVICNWDWSLSASGLFNVNRRLFSGIISLLVTYVVILSQLKQLFETRK